MDIINIIVDRHFPYSTALLENKNSRVRKIQTPKRLPLPLARIYHALDLYFKSFQADVILANRRSGLLLGFLYQLYKPKKSSLIAYEIIFNFKKNIKNKLVKLAWRLAVKKIDKLVVMTRSERTYLAKAFKTQPEKFATIPFYAEGARYIGPAPEGYIFSAGRMERDFETLIHSLQKTAYSAIIVADKSQKEKLEKIKPENVQILYNIPKERYLQLLEGAKMVAVPLFPGAASRGQVVILEAMKYGKPLVCTRVAGTVDYLEEGKDGLFVEPSDPAAMRQLFDTWFHNNKALEKMGKEAFKSLQNKYSEEVFYRNYQNLIMQEYAKKHKGVKREKIKTKAKRIHQGA